MMKMINPIDGTNRLAASLGLGSSASASYREHSEAGSRAAELRRLAEQAKDSAGEFIGKHPALTLAAAVSVGVIAGWLIKRRK